nr:bifunctional 3-dehydroquinate dehydratase/shikimate dehydrogenase, chloroplastic-like [Tanacetum cinerariifolium]GEZ58994.1 bifunctional 3-dehydroquinate dehydratase/shikimate dehydrogenase, chloroplastic-like [Tanacetum cinerariifolium]
MLGTKRVERMDRAILRDALPIEQLETYCSQNGMILANWSANDVEQDVRLTPVSKKVSRWQVGRTPTDSLPPMLPLYLPIQSSKIKKSTNNDALLLNWVTLTRFKEQILYAGFSVSACAKEQILPTKRVVQVPCSVDPIVAVVIFNGVNVASGCNFWATKGFKKNRGPIDIQYVMP